MTATAEFWCTLWIPSTWLVLSLKLRDANGQRAQWEQQGLTSKTSHDRESTDQPWYWYWIPNLYSEANIYEKQHHVFEGSLHSIWFPRMAERQKDSFCWLILFQDASTPQALLENSHSTSDWPFRVVLIADLVMILIFDSSNNLVARLCWARQIAESHHLFLVISAL